MTETKMLIGSLSNDLFRVASLSQRGSYQAAEKFLTEALRWAKQLSQAQLKPYIKKIIADLSSQNHDLHSLAKSEQFLTYSILLQNYALHLE